MTITRRRSNLFPKFQKIPAALDEYFAMAVSNRDLKPSGTSFWKNACDLGFAGYVFLGFLPPGGRLSHEAYSVERYDTYSPKVKIIKVRIEVKLPKVGFVVRPCKPTRIKR